MFLISSDVTFKKNNFKFSENFFEILNGFQGILKL